MSPGVSTESGGPAHRRHAHPLGFDLSVVIRRPPQRVFELLADVQDHEPIPRDAHVQMTKRPPTATCVGTRWDEEVRLVPGWWLRVESEVTDVHAPTTLAMDFRSRWFTGRLTYTIEAVPEGSVLHQCETVRLRRPLRWFRRSVERTLRRRLANRLADIRDLLEGGDDRPEFPVADRSA